MKFNSSQFKKIFAVANRLFTQGKYFEALNAFHQLYDQVDHFSKDQSKAETKNNLTLLQIIFSCVKKLTKQCDRQQQLIYWQELFAKFEAAHAKLTSLTKENKRFDHLEKHSHAILHDIGYICDQLGDVYLDIAENEGEGEKITLILQAIKFYEKSIMIFSSDEEDLTLSYQSLIYCYYLALQVEPLQEQKQFYSNQLIKTYQQLDLSTITDCFELFDAKYNAFSAYKVLGDVSATKQMADDLQILYLELAKHKAQAQNDHNDVSYMQQYENDFAEVLQFLNSLTKTKGSTYDSPKTRYHKAKLAFPSLINSNDLVQVPLQRFKEFVLLNHSERMNFLIEESAAELTTEEWQSNKKTLLLKAAKKQNKRIANVHDRMNKIKRKEFLNPTVISDVVNTTTLPKGKKNYTLLLDELYQQLSEWHATKAQKRLIPDAKVKLFEIAMQLEFVANAVLIDLRQTYKLDLNTKVFDEEFFDTTKLNPKISGAMKEDDESLSFEAILFSDNEPTHKTETVYRKKLPVTLFHAKSFNQATRAEFEFVSSTMSISMNNETADRVFRETTDEENLIQARNPIPLPNLYTRINALIFSKILTPEQQVSYINFLRALTLGPALPKRSRKASTHESFYTTNTLKRLR